MTTSACEGCFFYTRPLSSNPPSTNNLKCPATCQELERTKKCTFFSPVSTLTTQGLRSATLLARLETADIPLLHQLSLALMKDRSRFVTQQVAVGDWITFSTREGRRRERVGKVCDGFVLVGNEFDPVRVQASLIESINSDDKSSFPEFQELTPTQLKRLRQLRRQVYLAELKERRQGRAHRLNELGQLSSVKNVVAAVPNFVNAQRWIDENVLGKKPKKPKGKGKFYVPKFSVRATDVPFDFVERHGIAHRPDFCDLERPYTGTCDFVLFADTEEQALDKLKWLVARYNAKWPKETGKFVIETREEARKLVYGNLEGRYPSEYFRFALSPELPLDTYEKRGPKRMIKRGKGFVLVPGEPVFIGRQLSKRAPKTYSKYFNTDDEGGT